MKRDELIAALQKIPENADVLIPRMAFDHPTQFELYDTLTKTADGRPVWLLRMKPIFFAE